MITCCESNLTPVRQNQMIVLLFLMSCVIFAGCNSEQKTSSGGPVNLDSYFPIQLGESTLNLQLALTDTELQKGLMFRTELAEDHGMLFLFKSPKKQKFWMKNTSIPLDIGYFNASGRLLEVHQLFPYDETAVASRSARILIAVETNRDWYMKNGIGSGARLDMEALKAAILQRGFSPHDYALED